MPEVEQADQAPEQSAEDRIAAAFGVTDEQEAPPEEQVETEEVEAKPEEASEVEVEYEGERFKIPKQLEKAILQERDYTRKTQELANERRQVEHERKMAEAFHMGQEFNNSIAPELEQVRGLEGYLKSLESVDLKSLSLDDQLANLGERQRVPRMIDELKRRVDEKRAEFDKKLNEKVAEIRRSAKDVLSKQIPGFNDEIMQVIVSTAKSLGFSEQDVDGIVVDPRSSMLLYKAMKYDQLQTKKAAVTTKATPVIKPGASNPMPSEVKEKLNLRKAIKSASTSQAKAKLIEQYLAR